MNGANLLALLGEARAALIAANAPHDAISLPESTATLLGMRMLPIRGYNGRADIFGIDFERRRGA